VTSLGSASAAQVVESPGGPDADLSALTSEDMRHFIAKGNVY
jgi:hypothetical protein